MPPSIRPAPEVRAADADGRAAGVVTLAVRTAPAASFPRHEPEGARDRRMQRIRAGRIEDESIDRDAGILADGERRAVSQRHRQSTVLAGGDRFAEIDRGIGDKRMPRTVDNAERRALDARNRANRIRANCGRRPRRRRNRPGNDRPN